MSNYFVSYFNSALIKLQTIPGESNRRGHVCNIWSRDLSFDRMSFSLFPEVALIYCSTVDVGSMLCCSHLHISSTLSSETGGSEKILCTCSISYLDILYGEIQGGV